MHFAYVSHICLYNSTNKKLIPCPPAILDKTASFRGNSQDKSSGYILIKTQAVRGTNCILKNDCVYNTYFSDFSSN